MAAALLLAGLAAAAAGAPAPPFDLAQRSLLLTVHATGAQLYQCVAHGRDTPAWTLREPIAALIKEDKTIGRHFAGPSWELDDGSRITGRLAASAPGPSPADIPQLKVEVVSHAGHGVLDPVTTVYRAYTEGGRLAGSCDIPGDIRAVPYGAYYMFAR